MSQEVQQRGWNVGVVVLSLVTGLVLLIVIGNMVWLPVEAYQTTGTVACGLQFIEVLFLVSPLAALNLAWVIYALSWWRDHSFDSSASLTIPDKIGERFTKQMRWPGVRRDA